MKYVGIMKEFMNEVKVDSKKVIGGLPGKALYFFGRQI